jgi:hypothetical protein
LQKYGIKYRSEKIDRLSGSENSLKEVCFIEGDSLPADAMFFSAGRASGHRSRKPSDAKLMLTA